MKKVGLIKGDGIGPEISQCVVDIFKQAKVPVDFVEIKVGEKYHENKFETLPDEIIKQIKELSVVLKAPLMTPIGKGFSSINVSLRKKLNLDINYRPSFSIEGVETPFKNVDIVIIRENMQGMYSGEGQSVFKGVAVSKSVMDKDKLIDFFEDSFKLLIKKKRKKVLIVHKANILKSTSGMFLEVGRDVSKKYPELEVTDMIVDATAMNLVKSPEKFDSIITSNLFGDILSDLCSGLVGGLGVASGANLGRSEAIFEAVHGTAPDITGKNLANPTAFILSSCLMLDYLGLEDYSIKIKEVLFDCLRNKATRTKDLGGALTQSEFLDIILSKLK